MRKTLLTLVLVGLMALPVLAQRQGRGGFAGGMGGMQSGDALLLNKSVQAELKLTDAQKSSLEEISKTSREAMRKAFEDKENIKENMAKVNEERTKSLKKVKDGLTTVQAKRFEQIEVQVAAKTHDAKIFQSPPIQTALKLTPKQKEMVKETIADLEKDVKEVMAEAGKEKRRGAGLREKVTDLRKGAYEKISKGLTEEQSKTFTSLGGEKFEYKADAFGGTGGGRGKRGGKDKKKDDF